MPDTLNAGESLGIGQELTSNSGIYRFVMQTDGNLVMYENGTVPVWATDTWQLPAFFRPATADMQGDGNFVLYTATHLPVWASGTAGSGGTRLVLQNDRNAVIYTGAGVPVWATNTWVPDPGPIPAPTPGYPKPTQVPVQARKRVEVGWGKFMETAATLYRDGRLVLDVKTENNNWTGGLRGRLLVVGVDLRGNACWVSQEIQATTRCSIPDFSCASFGRDTRTENWPTEAAQIVDHLDLYMADGASFVDLRRAMTDAIKAAGELAGYLGPILAML